MPRQLIEFKCSNGHIHERFTNSSSSEEICPFCGSLGSRIISTPTIKLEGWSGSFPTAAQKWDKLHSKAAFNKNTDNPE